MYVILEANSFFMSATTIENKDVLGLYKLNSKDEFHVNTFRLQCCHCRCSDIATI